MSSASRPPASLRSACSPHVLSLEEGKNQIKKGYWKHHGICHCKTPSSSELCARATWSQYSLFGVCRQVRKGSNFTIAWSYREATADVFVWHGTFVGDLRRDGFRRVKYEENDGVLLFPPADNVVTLRFSFVLLKSDAWLVQRCLRFGIVGRRFQFRFWKEGKVLRWTGTVVGRSGRHLQVLYEFRQRVLSLPPPASACITPINVYFFPCCKCVTDMSSRTSVARATQQSCLEVGKRRPRLSNSKKHKGLEKNFMCFNTRSMKAPWRQRELDELLMQKSVSIACLQETRWKSIDAAKNITNYNVIMQPASPKGVGGVAILVRKDLEVEAMESANSSFQAARVGDHLFIINAHAPHAGRSRQVVTKWWDEFSAFTSSIEAKQIESQFASAMYIFGDFNAPASARKELFVPQLFLCSSLIACCKHSLQKSQ